MFAVSRSGLGPVGRSSRVTLKKPSFGRQPRAGSGRPLGVQAARGCPSVFPAQPILFSVPRSGFGPVVFSSRFILEKSPFGGWLPSRCPSFISFHLVSTFAARDAVDVFPQKVFLREAARNWLRPPYRASRCARKLWCFFLAFKIVRSLLQWSRPSLLFVEVYPQKVLLREVVTITVPVRLESSARREKFTRLAM